MGQKVGKLTAEMNRCLNQGCPLSLTPFNLYLDNIFKIGKLFQ